jgi:hypothetical protein
MIPGVHFLFQASIIAFCIIKPTAYLHFDLSGSIAINEAAAASAPRIMHAVKSNFTWTDPLFTLRAVPTLRHLVSLPLTSAPQ